MVSDLHILIISINNFYLNNFFFIETSLQFNSENLFIFIKLVILKR